MVTAEAEPEEYSAAKEVESENGKVSEIVKAICALEVALPEPVRTTLVLALPLDVKSSVSPVPCEPSGAVGIVENADWSADS